MNYLSRLLELMTRALFGRRIPGCHSRPAQAPDVAQEWRPNVAGARVLRRTRQAPPAPQGRPPQPWEATGALVRPYIVALGNTINARPGAQAYVWGDVQ